MPKNKGKGGKNRRRGKNEGEEKRELELKSEGLEYGKVTRMLGNGRLTRQVTDDCARETQRSRPILSYLLCLSPRFLFSPSHFLRAGVGCCR